MTIPRSLTTVTPLSKALAMIFFILFPFIGFYAGMQYQELIDMQNIQTVNTDPSAINHPAPSAVIQQTTSQKANVSTGSSESKDWKTYTNQAYKFSLRYPPTLKVFSNGDFAADLVDQNINQEILTPSNIKVRIGASQTGRNFEKIYAAGDNSIIPEEQHALDATFTKLRNRMISGYKAIDYTYDVPGNQTEKSFTIGTIINKNGTLIEIKTWKLNSKEFDQILSTFQFTD